MRVDIELIDDPAIPSEFMRIAAIVVRGDTILYTHTATIPKNEYSKDVEKYVATAALNKVLYEESLLNTPEDTPEEKEESNGD